MRSVLSGRRGGGLAWVCPVMRLQRGEERGVYCLLLSGQASRTGGVLGSLVSLTQGDCVRLWSLPKASSPHGPPCLLPCLLLASACLLNQLAFFSVFSLGYIEYIVLEKLTMFTNSCGSLNHRK